MSILIALLQFLLALSGYSPHGTEFTYRVQFGSAALSCTIRIPDDSAQFLRQVETLDASAQQAQHE